MGGCNRAPSVDPLQILTTKYVGAPLALLQSNSQRSFQGLGPWNSKSDGACLFVSV